MKKIIIATAVLITLVLGLIGASNAQSDWEYIETGYDYILYDMSWPEGQSEIGFAVGSTSTYNGDGIILQTTDGGDTWNQLSGDDLPGLEACYFTSLDVGYVGGWDNYFAKTTDGGETWTEIEIDPNIWFIIDMEFWDENNGIVACWGALAFVTDDGGETWTEATGVSGIQDLCYASADVLYSAGGDENICKSEDGGLTWTEIYSGVFQYVFVGVEFLNEDFGFVGGEDGKVLMTEDGGDTWTENPTTFYHLWHAFHIFNEDSIYVAGTPEAVYKTTDGGATFVDDYPESNFDAAFYKIHFTADNNTGFVCGSQGIVLRKETPELLPAIGVDPNQINFGEVVLGETAQEVISLSNTGNGMLSVTNITCDLPAFVPDITVGEIAPGNTLEVTVTFEPGEVGTAIGILSIESNDPVTPIAEVDLQGEGIEELLPIGSVSPDEIFFPQTWIGETSQASIVISNDGNAPLEVTNIASDNSVFSPDIQQLFVDPADSEEVMIVFAPNSEEYFEGTLTIECNDPVNPIFEVNLMGEGLQQQAVISVVSELTFDTTVVGTFSTQSLDISNIGNATLEITDVVSSDDAFIVDITSLVIEPGQTETIGIDFSPLVQGPHEASLEIVSNDAGSPEIVELAGYAVLEVAVFDNFMEATALVAVPNPFNEQVSIRLSAESNTLETLKVYNMIGGLVQVIDAELINGIIEYYWDGANQYGEVAPSGIYFGVLKTPEFEKSIKLIKR